MKKKEKDENGRKEKMIKRKPQKSKGTLQRNEEKQGNMKRKYTRKNLELLKHDEETEK